MGEKSETELHKLTFLYKHTHTHKNHLQFLKNLQDKEKL